MMLPGRFCDYREHTWVSHYRHGVLCWYLESDTTSKGIWDPGQREAHGLWWEHGVLSLRINKIQPDGVMRTTSRLGMGKATFKCWRQGLSWCCQMMMWVGALGFHGNWGHFRLGRKSSPWWKEIGPSQRELTHEWGIEGFLIVIA